MQVRRTNSFGRTIFIATASINAMSAAHAGELQTSPGQPVCIEKAELQEYLLAMLQQDAKWMSELRSCAPLIGGAKVTVIESYENDSGIAKVVKVRVFSPKGKGSAVGYTLDLGLKEK